MVACSWSDRYAVGVTSIDTYHKALFDYFDMLRDAVADHAAPEAITEILTHLHTCLETHFADEEAFMTEHHFSGLSVHKKIHDDFLTRISDIIAAHENKAAHVDFAAVSTLHDWLVQHTQGTDRRMVQDVLSRSIMRMV